MTGWYWECACGWSLRSAPTESDSSVVKRVRDHRDSHEDALRRMWKRIDERSR